MSEKILIVDDERDICEILEFNLSNAGYGVSVAYSAEEALEKLTTEHSLILLDVMMSGMSGFEMAQQLRESGNNTPVIFLTAKDAESDLLQGFSAGGDDYISKPFSIREVLARVGAVLKRSVAESATEHTDGRIIIGDIVIDSTTKTLYINGVEVVLTKTEFEILLLLASHPERIFSREEIIGSVRSDAPYVTERTVDVHITRLRKKLGTYAAHISNRAGYGYCFKPVKL